MIHGEPWQNKKPASESAILREFHTEKISECKPIKIGKNYDEN